MLVVALRRVYCIIYLHILKSPSIRWLDEEIQKCTNYLTFAIDLDKFNFVSVRNHVVAIHRGDILREGPIEMTLASKENAVHSTRKGH